MNGLTHLSLFSGIGGLDLAAEWAGITTVGQCEWADYPAKVLEKHWPDVPRWRDIRTLTGEDFYERTGLRTVDIISGGFPCQPFSVAGKRRGKEDDRFLWPEMVRVIKELRPTWVVGENVAGIVKMALPDILSELEACGYRTRTFLIPACAVGARHRRYRVAIVGYSEHNGLPSTEIPGGFTKTGGGQQEREKTSCKFERAGKTRDGETLANSERQHERGLSFGESKAKPGFIGGGEDVADTQSERNWGLSVQQRRSQQENPNIERCSKDVQHSDCTGCKEQHSSRKPDQQGSFGGRCDAGNVCHPASPGLPDGSVQQMERPEQEPKFERSGGTTRKRTAQPGLGGMADGLPDRMDRDFLIEHYWDEEPDIPRTATGIKDRVGRLKCLGNAVVPQQFYPVFQAIAEIEQRKSRGE